MPKALNCIWVTVLIVLSGHPMAALAATVTNADLAGKKICWNNGAIATYGKDGSFSCSKCGHGTWRLDGDTLTENAARGAAVWKITKDGGTFDTQSGNNERRGSYCK